MRNPVILALFIVVLGVPFISRAQDIVTVVGNGIPGYIDNVSATMAELNNPNTLAFDRTGDMYVVDYSNNRIRKINSSGIITTIAGNGTPGFSGDNGPATLAELQTPDAITIDDTGNMYISVGNRIRKINTSGIITTIAGIEAAGYNGDNILATSAQLSNPYVGMTDNVGNLYFSDYGNHRVRKISTVGIITTIAGNGLNTSSGDGSPATAASLGGPTWLFVNSSGELYIPDNSFYNVRKVDASGIITTFAGTGVRNSTGDNGLATMATFIQPNSITFDNAGNAYIADYGASVVRKVNTAGIISAVAGNGSPVYSGDGGSATLAGLTANSVTCDGSGNVYIADYENNRIRRVTYNTTAVNEIKKSQQNLTIYPNPAHETISIKANEEIESLEVVNVVGITTPCHSSSFGNSSGQAQEKESLLSVTDLPNGIYFVKVNGVYAGRFVKE